MNEPDGVNKLEQSLNKAVHQTNEHGDPVRDETGAIQLKPDWKKSAVDRQGRTFNPKIHESEGSGKAAKPVLDSEGYINVVRRAAAKSPSATNKTEAFVNKHREPGYTYRVINDEGGRIDQFTNADWEPVMTEEGIAKMKVGQARQPGTTAVLMKKPIEWYEQDQVAKCDQRAANHKSKTAPKEGQYEADKSSPLR